MLDNFVLAPGDLVTVTRIDRLARRTFDVFAIVKKIVDAKAQFRSLVEPWPTPALTLGGCNRRSGRSRRDERNLTLNTPPRRKLPTASR
jgi:hypothetical protein